MNHRERILQLLEAQSVIRPRDLREIGAPASYLTRLVDDGVLRRSGRGIYIAVDADANAYQSLVEVATRVPHGVICLLSALRFHELTTEAPHEVWIAVSSTVRIPKVDYPPVRAFRFSDAAFTFGVEDHAMNGVALRVYSPAKTVADCFKFRNRIGVDVAVAALQDCWRSRKATTDEDDDEIRDCWDGYYVPPEIGQTEEQSNQRSPDATLAEFTPIVLNLDTNLDPAKIQLRFDYEMCSTIRPTYTMESGGVPFTTMTGAVSRSVMVRFACGRPMAAKDQVKILRSTEILLRMVKPILSKIWD